MAGDQPPPSPDAHPQPSSPPTDPHLETSQTEKPASDPPSPLGPASDTPITTLSAPGSHLSITLLLTTGARHPYKIDEKYLRSRKVELRTASSLLSSEARFEPRELSGYQLKELIWTDWRPEWEPRPASPSSIRLIIMGRLIEDKAMLKDYLFSMDSPNVVHMTVKPADLVDDDDATGGKGPGKSGILRARDGEERGAGCRCVVS